jgi:hypothetical protein
VRFLSDELRRKSGEITEEERKKLSGLVAKLSLAGYNVAFLSRPFITAFDGKRIIPRFDESLNKLEELIKEYKDLRKKQMEETMT